MNDRNLTVARNQDELEPRHESGTMRIAPLRQVDRASLIGDWFAETDDDADRDDIEPHRDAPTRPVPRPTDAEQAAVVHAQLDALAATKFRLEARLVELGEAVYGGQS